MKWSLATILILMLLTPMVGDPYEATTGPMETAFSSEFAERSSGHMDRLLPDPVGLYLLADKGNDGDANNNGTENGEEKEKDLEADPAGGVDRIWNSVQLA